MARPWRIQYEGAIYHVMSRGVGRGKIFLTNGDYSRFLEYMASVREKFNLDIFAFVLMANHYHILLRTNDANLSKAMQWIQTAYSIYYNRNHNRCGHLFQGRYKSVLVENESYWHILSLYIHLNPLRAGMVEKLREYNWSSYHDYVNVRKRNKWVNSEAVLEGIVDNYKIDKTTLLERKRRIPIEARDMSMYMLKTYTGLKNREIGEIFGVGISAVNKAALRISMRSKTSESFRKKMERTVYSIFKV